MARIGCSWTSGYSFGRNSTGGVINLITARPDLDAFSGSTKLQYASDGEKLVNVMLNVPISDALGARFAFRNFERDGLTKIFTQKLRAILTAETIINGELLLHGKLPMT